MDAIISARELGKAIQSDDRYTRLMKAQEKNDSDTELQKSIQEFNELRTKLNEEIQKQDSDKDVDEIKQMDAKLKEMYKLIFENENMVEYTNARNELQEMLTFVNQIITGSTNGENPDDIQPQAECGGSCGSCGGCS